MNDKVPGEWVWAKMLDILDYEGGSQPPKKEFIYDPREGYVRLLQIRDFGDKPFPTYVPDSKRLKKATRNDLLLARYGGSSGSDSLGRICTGLEGAYNVALAKLIFRRDLLEKNYVKYLFLGPWFRQKVSQNSRSCQTGFNREDVVDIEFPLAPLNEQRRIVAKLEKLLDKVDACQQRLVRIPALLKHFRQSILAAACSGRLTADWREEHPSNLDGKNLLRSLLSTRKAKWEAQQLEKFKTQGRMPKDGSWKTAYPECRQSSSDGLSPLPADWTWIALAGVVTRVKRGPSMKCNQKAQGVRYITSGNLEAGKLRLDLDQKYLTGFDEIEKCRLLPGDLILNCVNSLAKIGKSAVFEAKHGEAIVGFNNYALELSTDFISAYFLNLVCQNDVFLSQLYLVVKHAVNQVSFATEELEKVAVPVPPLAEQQEIVRRVEALFALADQLEARYAKAKAHVDKLTQSILAKAFRGELVPQDPNDESASVLLQRIKAQKPTHNAASKSTRRRRSPLLAP